MLILAFAAFAILVLAWLLAPNGDVAETPVPAVVPPLKVGDAVSA